VNVVGLVRIEDLLILLNFVPHRAEFRWCWSFRIGGWGQCSEFDQASHQEQAGLGGGGAKFKSAVLRYLEM
jgi:hypothetical protein